ncbi:MAG: LAGLIDADG family homing endonuclease [Candidatus Nanoarchaeia archaeon]|nr:LAGLIDADG family homing endonuclease [Candidatus Nanoarchaeia archaeon]
MDLKNKAIKLKKLSWKIEDIAKELNISSRTVSKYTQTVPHPNNVHAKKPLSNSAKILTIELAEILGYICAEGCDSDYIDNHWGYDKRRGKSYRRSSKRVSITFSNTDEGLKKHFINIFNKVFGYSRHFNKSGNFCINRIEVVKYLRDYSLFGSKRWKVPKQIKNANNKIKSAFCRAYFDGDGTIETKKKEIRLDSTNENGLKEVKTLLDNLKFNSHFYSFKGRYRIVIREIEGFSKIIGSNHPKKREQMELLIKNK